MQSSQNGHSNGSSNGYEYGSNPAWAAEPRQMKGSQMVWEALVMEGVNLVFGHPGGAILPTYDALSSYEAEGKIHHVLVRHEQCAAHMADGYARATGRVGVCIATSGPGATNLVTGLATAQMDSIPMVAITGQVPTNLLGTDAFQESDVVGVTQPVVKHNYLVTDVNELPMIMKEAFHIAREGRPGVVLVDICKDVQNAMGWFRYDLPVDLPGFEPWPEVDATVIRRAADLINRAERPLVLVHPDDAAACGVADGGEVLVRSAHGETNGVVRLDDGIRQGVVSMPHGFADTRVGALLSGEGADPFTGMVLQSGVPVALAPVAAAGAG